MMTNTNRIPLTLVVSTSKADVRLAGEIPCPYPDCEAKLGANQVQVHTNDGTQTVKMICDGPDGCHRDVLSVKLH
jgi:hypothetical protein